MQIDRIVAGASEIAARNGAVIAYPRRAERCARRGRVVRLP